MDHPELLQAYKSKRNRINIIHIVASVIIAVLLVLMAASSAKADTYDELVARYQNQTTEVGIMPGSEVEYLKSAEYVEHPYQTINISDSEFNELRWVLALEAQTQGVDGEIACCEVVFNRCLSQKNNWGGSVHGVLSRKKQFSTYKLIGSRRAWTSPGQMEDDAISETLRGTSVIQKYLVKEQAAGRIPVYVKASDYVYFDTGAKNGKWNLKIGNHYFGAET